jgi:orotate phosphoribosyltransferase
VAPTLSAQLASLLTGRRGHFQMESGYHSEWWYDLDALFADRARLQPFVVELAVRLAAYRLDAVCGPQVGGAKLAAAIAAVAGLTCFTAERHADPAATGLFPVRYHLPPVQRPAAHGLRVAIVDDAISAGSAVRGTCADLLACGASPVACGALFLFGEAIAPFAAEHSLALEALARPPYSLWLPPQCPLCHAGLPFESVSDAAPSSHPSL